MRINTAYSLMEDREKVTNKIIKFWNQLSEGWREIWGPHLHHGYYEENNPLTPLQAQELLLEKLIEMTGIKPKNRILDVGCGMGGTSLYLAKKYQAYVIGITLSSKQLEIANKQAQEDQIATVRFKLEDALSLASFGRDNFDIVWSLESCEQFFNKSTFINQAYRVLKPGGKFMLATWCSSHEIYEGKAAKDYRKLCFAFDLPYMPTMNYYAQLLQARGFQLQHSVDWSKQVGKSWDVGIELFHSYPWFKLLKIAGFKGLRFIKQLQLMRNAFSQQRIHYGVFLATKP